MTYSDIVKEIEKFVETTMLANLSSIHYGFGSSVLEVQPVAGEIWVLFTPVFSHIDKLELGLNGGRAINGLLLINIHGVKQDRRAMLELASQVETLFTRQIVNGVYIDETTDLKEITKAKDLNFSMSLPFHNLN
ncbi:hypothetical protein KAR91_30710 [Candidatus Pacearchaeota archaeon]|nr:hypothetical protein [Candidatus Pacearchaeota archaeon]